MTAMINNVEILPVHPSLVDTVWDAALVHLGKAIALNDGFVPDDVRVKIYTGEFQLWLAVVDGALKGALVTQILNYPQKRTLFLLFMGGRQMKAWLKPMEETIVDYTRMIGATEIESLARRGFAYFFDAEKSGIEWFRRKLS